MTNEERIYTLIESAYSLAVTATNRITELKQENSELKKRVAKLENASKSKRKFRAMTNIEFCNKNKDCCTCSEYKGNIYGCYKFMHGIDSMTPYRTTDGKYIMVEVIE